LAQDTIPAFNAAGDGWCNRSAIQSTKAHYRKDDVDRVIRVTNSQSGGGFEPDPDLPG